MSKLSKIKNQKSLKDYLADYKEVIAVLLSIASSIWLFITNLKVSSNFKEFSSNVNSFLSMVEFLNVLVLIASILMLIRKYNLVKKRQNGETPNLVLLEPDNPIWKNKEDIATKKQEEVNWKIERVNKLVSQLILSLQGFAVILLFMYTLLSLTDLKQGTLDENDKKEMKIEDFINDPSEISDPNLEYSKIINSFNTPFSNDIKQKHIDTNAFSGKNNPYKTILSKIRVYKSDTGSYPITAKNLNKYKVKLDSLTTLYNSRKNDEYLLDSLKSLYYSKIINALATARGELGVIKKRNNSLEKSNSLIETIYHEKKIDRFAMRYLIIEFVENAFNLFSATFLYMAFQVLFTITLSADNTKSKINYWLPFSIAGAILIVNFLGITIGIGTMPLSSISHLVRLLSGLYNGIGMILLFSRFISIEYFYTKEAGFKKGFYYVGTIFILPFYAAAQALYGIFDLDNKDIGNALILKAVVLLICFIGKLFLFLFIASILENEWLHKYFYWLLLKTDSMENVSEKIKEDLKLVHQIEKLV